MRSLCPDNFFPTSFLSPHAILLPRLRPTNNLLSLLPWSTLFSPKLVVLSCPRPQSLDLLFSPSKLILLVTSSRVMALNTYLLPMVTFTFPAQFSSVQSFSRVQLFVTLMDCSTPRVPAKSQTTSAIQHPTQRLHLNIR